MEWNMQGAWRAARTRVYIRRVVARKAHKADQSEAAHELVRRARYTCPFNARRRATNRKKRVCPIAKVQFTG